MFQSTQDHERSPPDPESFIPLSRCELIERCLADDRLDQCERALFRRFCEILTAYFHYDFHDEVEQFKAAYASLNPDAAVDSNHTEDDHAGAQVAELFRSVVARANYREITAYELQQALEERSLVNVRTKVDMRDYQRVEAFCRGDNWTKMTVKRLVFWEREIDVDILQRVALLMQFKRADYFKTSKHGRRPKRLPFEPGKVYLFLYKDVPKNDLELLFPNVQISMNWKDRLLFGVPAVGAAIPILLKLVPKILIIVGVIAFFTLGADFAQELGVGRDTIQDFMPLAAATLAIAVALGAFAVKQYNNFQNKKIRFQRDVTDTLFFRNQATNISVLHRLIDQAEEAETKEVILVYYHLTTNRHSSLAKEEIDAQIEQWLMDTVGSAVDFDIEGPIHNLQRIRHNDGRALLDRDSRGRYQVPTPEEAVQIVEDVWDRLVDLPHRA